MLTSRNERMIDVYMFTELMYMSDGSDNYDFQQSARRIQVQESDEDFGKACMLGGSKDDSVPAYVE